MLIEKIQAYLNGYITPSPERVELAETWRKSLTPAYVTNRQAERENGHFLRPSGMGGCTRQLAYKKLGVEPEPFQARFWLTVELGDLIEQQMTYYSILATKTFMPGQDQATVTIHGYEVPCHRDGVMNADDDPNKYKIIIDFKSTNTRSFTRKKGNTRTPPEHDEKYRIQMMYYMKAYNCPYSMLLYYNKDTSMLLEHYENWDINLWEAIEEKALDVIQSTMDDLPEREYHPTKNWQCTYCQFMYECYPEYEKYFDGRAVKVRLK